MKRLLFPLLLAGVLAGCGAARNLPSATQADVKVAMDLVNVPDDRVQVTLDPGAFPEGPVRFFIPKTVPGTYSEDNYGRYVDDLKAYDYRGNELPVQREGDNTWLIAQGASLDRIHYAVNDSYDTEASGDDAPFSPAGTNILAGQNFVLNLHGFVGYFQGLKERPYEITVSAPQNLYPATSLPWEKTPDEKYLFRARRYFEVIDNPIQFTASAPESFQVGDITVHLSVYSPNGVYSAADLKPAMQRMMQAQKAFLGPISGTKQYTILVYLSTMDDDAYGFGALEHHTSTMVVFPEQMPPPQLEESMIDVVSHEFFHTVTPLNVHSEEIQYFDYNEPKMSRHLWMYEGTTEYFANLFQVKEGLIDEADFYRRMYTKIMNARRYNDSLSFTEMSQHVLEEPYSDQYTNVYEKGALINMALDIRLRELSGGSYGVLDLMRELSAKYDSDTPFKDDALIGEIVAMTYPEIQEFFDTHVSGSTPIDYGAFLAKVGLTLGDVEVESGYFLTDMESQIPFIDVDPADTDVIFVREGISLNTFFQGLGAQGGDVIRQINGTDITLDGIRMIIGQSFAWTPETEVTMVVERDGETLTLQGQAGKPTYVETRIAPDPDASEAQLRLRQAWLKG